MEHICFLSDEDGDGDGDGDGGEGLMMCDYD
jgi:hypothetical protein